MNIYNSRKSLSTKLMEPNKSEHLCISYKQSRHWKHADITFKDNPQGFFSWYTDFFLWVCKSHCTKTTTIPLLANLHLMFVCAPRQCWTKWLWLRCRAEEAACGARFSSCLHHLPARASSRAARGWISWHTFERKALSVALHTSVRTVGCPVWHVAGPSQHMPGPELSVCCICSLCHVTDLMVGNNSHLGQPAFASCQKGNVSVGKQLWANC